MGRRSTRKKIHREPNGRLVRDEPTAPAEAKRLRDAAMRDVMSAEYGTELGRLFLAKSIDATMYAAGKRMWELHAAYQVAMQSPAMGRLSLDGGRSQPVDPDSDAGASEARRHARAIRNYESAMQTLHSYERAAIDRAAIVGLPLVGFQEFLNLKAALSTLADHFGLTQRKLSVVK